ncbi:MAG: tRNA (adenosine(37)-N6)-threonylcarbamoyltransferase complex ATPase subunit type 1 TsaE [Ignavibacteriaceae bacterium]
MDFPYTKKVFTEEDTINLAGEFVNSLSAGNVIVLNGNLGAGKTFFIKHALKIFGINNVNSPTFAIVNEYSGKFKIYHFDFYRVNNLAELFDLGINDYLNDDRAITFIEWGNLLQVVLPKKRFEININLNEDFSRDFNFIKYE